MRNDKGQRVQKPKPRNQQFNEAMREKGSSNAASPFRNKAKYSRSDRRDKSWSKGF